MMSALKVAATGMLAQQLNVDVLSNNISNMNTTAYKRQQAAFSDLVYQNIQAVGAATSGTGNISPTGTQRGLGVNVGSIYRVHEQGPVNKTGNVFDMAVQGRGFFKVTLPDGTLGYTRDGSFQINQDGELVSKEGYFLDPGINIPENAVDITVSEDGVVSAKVDDQITQLGDITLAMFTNEAGLEAQGNNLYLETEASGAPADVVPGEDGSGTLIQGFLETSNVDPVTAVTELIKAQRAYELNSRVISTADEMMSATNQIR